MAADLNTKHPVFTLTSGAAFVESTGIPLSGAGWLRKEAGKMDTLDPESAKTAKANSLKGPQTTAK
eukprot:6464307-Amphidinium_carterae.1